MLKIDTKGGVYMTTGNGCNSEGCNVLQIVGIQMTALANTQTENMVSIKALINEKFDNMEKSNIKESNRIDELRKGDMEAVRLANESAVKRAEQLSIQLIETAETVRKTTDTLASTLALQFQQVTARQDEKIAALERANWTNSGKEGATPSVQSLVADLISIKNTNATNAGIGVGQQLTKNGLITILTVAGTLISIVVILINFFK